MNLKFWEKQPKKKSIEDEIFLMDGMDAEELSREDCTPERRRELRVARELNQRTLADIEKAKIDRDKGVKVALIGLGGTIATILGVIGWNTIQHGRNNDIDDDVQMDLNRDQNSSVRAGGKILESLSRRH